jgi:hypothetical protein
MDSTGEALAGPGGIGKSVQKKQLVQVEIHNGTYHQLEIYSYWLYINKSINWKSIIHKSIWLVVYLPLWKTIVNGKDDIRIWNGR